jgi:hypothetical protein
MPSGSNSTRSTLKIGARVVAGAAFAALTLLGIRNGLRDSGSAQSPLQQAQAGLQLVYAATALYSLLAVWRPTLGLDHALILFTVAFGAAGLLAPVAWAQADWGAGALGGLFAIVVAGCLAWLARWAMRP